MNSTYRQKREKWWLKTDFSKHIAIRVEMSGITINYACFILNTNLQAINPREIITTADWRKTSKSALNIIAKKKTIQLHLETGFAVMY